MEKFPERTSETHDFTEEEFDARDRVEVESRPERLSELRKEIESLFGGGLAVLRKPILASFDVPQFGPYHNEGMLMDTHLDLMRQNLEQATHGGFEPEIPEEARTLVQQIAQPNREQLLRYVYLHDLAKGDRLQIKLEKGVKEWDWKAWKRTIPPDAQQDSIALRALLRKEGVTSISYYHKKPKGQHGEAAVELIQYSLGVADDLARQGFEPAMLTAIKKHEVAYQFTGVRPETYRKHLGTLSEEEQNLALVASYLDTASSLRKNGKPDFTNFIALFRSREATRTNTS